MTKPAEEQQAMEQERRDRSAHEDWLRLAPDPPQLKQGQQWHVFLSYRSVNRTWVLHLYDALKQAGFQVFLDQLEIPPGSTLVERLNQALDSSAAGVIVWSTDFADSAWCQAEYATMQSMATNSGGDFKFVVAKLGPAKLPPLVRKDVYLDFTDYPDGPHGGELLKLLYGLRGLPLSKDALRAALDLNEETKTLVHQIQGAKETSNIASLQKLAMEGGRAWQTSPLLYSMVAESLIGLAEYDLALQVLALASRQFRKAIRPIQLEALALARQAKAAVDQSRQTTIDDAERATARNRADELLNRAQQMLAELYRRDHRDPETLGIYGRTWMDRYEITRKREYLEKSRDLYALAFELTDTDYYTGINAAAKSVFLGDMNTALALAGKVEALVGDKSTPGDYWKSATAAEAQLIKRNFQRAATLYRKAVVDSPDAAGDHGSTRLQAQRLLEHLDPPPDAVRDILAVFPSPAPVAR